MLKRKAPIFPLRLDYEEEQQQLYALKLPTASQARVAETSVTDNPNKLSLEALQVSEHPTPAKSGRSTLASPISPQLVSPLLLCTQITADVATQ